MRENMSLLSFWGLVFSLIAVTLFVVIYSYQKSKYAAFFQDDFALGLSNARSGTNRELTGASCEKRKIASNRKTKISASMVPSAQNCYIQNPL